MPIITHLDEQFPVLVSPSINCEFPLTIDFMKKVTEMKQLIEDDDGAVGIAAPQIGYSRNLFIAKIRGGIKTFINPKITRRSKHTRKRVEGCLSLPGIPIETKRPKEITLSYFDEEAEHHEETFFGSEAQIICHEMDHLSGRLITDLVKQDNSVPRTSFGMKITKQKSNQIKKRRAKEKRRRAVKRKSRS